MFLKRCGQKAFGAKDEQEYQHWWRRACGIVSLATVVNALRPDVYRKHPFVVLEEINDALKTKAYLQYKNDGVLVEVGWIHHKLIDLARRRGVHGKALQLTINGICHAITKNQLVIVGVSTTIEWAIDDPSKRQQAGGHLIVIKGFVWHNGQCTGLFIEDPYDIAQRSEAIDIRLYSEIYSGSAMVLY